jgi:phosphoenolpyruvate---glycerone phosphotransferase subunit DhaL
MDAVKFKTLIQSATSAMIDRVDELTQLDQAIGDGDHGLNMKRGCEAVLADAALLSDMPIGTKLVMTVGGASGPLYGSLFLGLSKSIPDFPSREQFVEACRAGIEAVVVRGKSTTGQKTMLDVLVPTMDALALGKTPSEISVIADDSALATIPMKATRGRASYLGDRSIGHMDPGACSSAILVKVLARELAN